MLAELQFHNQEQTSASERKRHIAFVLECDHSIFVLFWQSNSLFGTEGKRTLFWFVASFVGVLPPINFNCQLFSTAKLFALLHSIHAVGVEIGKFHGMTNEKNVLLLPGLPLVSRPGENPEPDLWTFEVETPDASVATGDSPTVMIDYVHPGTCACVLCVSMACVHVRVYVSTPYSTLSDLYSCLQNGIRFSKMEVGDVSRTQIK